MSHQLQFYKPQDSPNQRYLAIQNRICNLLIRKKYPGVSFRIFHTPAQQDLHDYDFCISCTPPNEQYREGLPLVTEKLHLLVSAEYRFTARTAVRFDELKNEEFALLDKDSSLWRHTVHLCQQSGFEPRISMICGDLHCLTKFVSTGMAVTLGPEVSWRGISMDNLAFVPTVPEVIRTTYVFENSRKNSSMLRQTFLEFLTEFFSKLQA